MNSASLKFSEQDVSFSVSETPKGISGISIVTKRGKPGNTGFLVKSWPEFVKMYGGLSVDNEGPLQAKVMLEGGSQLRVNSVQHYDDITDGTLEATEAELIEGIQNIIIDGTPVTGQGPYTLAITSPAGTYTSAVADFSPTITTGKQVLEKLISQLKQNNPTLILGAGYSKLEGGDHTLWVTLKSGATTIATATLEGPTTATDGIDGVTVTDSVTFQHFQLTPMGPGSGYNGLNVLISPASNSQPTHFDLSIWIPGEEENMEVYPNLVLERKNAGEQTSLDSITLSSYLVDLTYLDLTGAPVGVRPTNGLYVFDGGLNGSAPVATDYIGDVNSKTGWHSFDNISDIVGLGAPALEDDNGDVLRAGANYATTRQDIFFFMHLPSTPGITENALVQLVRETMLIDTSYAGWFTGGLKVIDPLTGRTKEISELGAVMALADKSAVNHGMNYSFAGPRRGIIFNAQGPVNNYVTSQNGMNQLANAGINTIIAEDGRIMLWNCLTAQTIGTSLLSFINVRRALIDIKKNLRPVIKRYIEEPNIMDTWKMIYLEASAYLDRLYDKKWFFPSKQMPKGYRWEGDQFAKDLDSLQVNEKAEVLQGKYKVRLFVTPTPALREAEIIITIMGSNISFEELLG